MAKWKKKHFELRDAQHDKFWEIDVTGARVTVRFGRLGSAGVEKVTKLATPAEAERAAGSLVEQKTNKGYRAVPMGSAPKAAKLPAGVKGQLARLSAGFEKRLRPGASEAALAKFRKALGLNPLEGDEPPGDVVRPLVREEVPDEDPDEAFFDAFNGGIDQRIRRKTSPGYPKRPRTAKSLF